MARCRRSGGFTLIEVMMVILIIGLMAGLIAFLPRSERRLSAVRSAAEELAATLRTARAMAMDQRIVCGVAFNIQNAPGTSGKVLNNHSGGHWYQILRECPGVDSETALASYPRPTFVPWRGSNLAFFLRQVKDSWAGERHVLMPKRVRFLALGDQDNGSSGWKGSGIFPPTYPRPWFGWWDPSTRRLYPWGGYDTALTDGAGRKCSAFYYEGNDGPVTGSTNSADRLTTHVGPAPGVPPTAIFTAGKGRPLVKAEWLDYVIEFYPDGTAAERSPMVNRRTSWWERDNNTTNNNHGGGINNGDFGDYTAYPGTTWNDDSPITSYVAHTGVWSITLAPDMEQDIDVFPTKEAALDSIWPAYRVTVSPFGEVKTVRVTRVIPTGAVLDTTSVSDWQNSAQINSYYRNFIATRTVAGVTSLRGKPVASFLSPEILAARQWWIATP